MHYHTHTHTHTLPFNGPFKGTTRVGRYQIGKINLDFTEARDSEWQWHQLGHMQVCTSLHADAFSALTLLVGRQEEHPTTCTTTLQQLATRWHSAECTALLHYSIITSE